MRSNRSHGGGRRGSRGFRFWCARLHTLGTPLYTLLGCILPAFAARRAFLHCRAQLLKRLNEEIPQPVHIRGRFRIRNKPKKELSVITVHRATHAEVPTRRYLGIGRQHPLAHGVQRRCRARHVRADHIQQRHRENDVRDAAQRFSFSVRVATSFSMRTGPLASKGSATGRNVIWLPNPFF